MGTDFGADECYVTGRAQVLFLHIQTGGKALLTRKGQKEKILRKTCQIYEYKETKSKSIQKTQSMKKTKFRTSQKEQTRPLVEQMQLKLLMSMKLLMEGRKVP